VNWLRAILAALTLGLLLVGPQTAHAVLPSEVLSDPALEARARALSAELRCMVCQNQSIDDSDAPLAADLRILVRERIVAGDTDAEVIDFLVARYGEFILLKPRVSWHTALLWAAPPVILVIAGLVAFAGYRKRRKGAAEMPAPLDATERKALERLVSDGKPTSNITDS
jgi:cytochrome c-type biogenesis protein CcmH